MKELSDIKSNLAVNSSETINIKNSITEIKTDIREIKNNGVTQEQHKDLIKNLDEKEIRITVLESSKTSTQILLSIGIGILTLLTSLLIYHLVGSK